MEGMLDRLQAARTWYVEAVDALGEASWRKPSLCAGWDAARVVAHVAGGDRLTRALALDATGRDSRLLATLPTGQEELVKRADAMAAWEPPKLREAARSESEEMVRVLREFVEQAPETKLRMPFGEVPVNDSVVVLHTYEYIVHGHDLEPASGRHQPVPRWYIDLLVPRAMQGMTRAHARSPQKGKSASFHFHRTDGDGEWTLRAEGGQATCDAGHGRGEVAFRGPGEALYWVLMGRGRPAELGVEVHGDPGLAGSFKEWFPGP